MAPTLEQFVHRLVESGLMSAEQIRAFENSYSADSAPQDVQSLARELVLHGKITKYQAGRIYQGKIKELVLGNYVVLDKIGEGGMGEVFKAEHRRMKRVVAVKVLPQSVTATTRARKRFQREVEAAAQLVHPNIVTAFDADESDGVHFLVMEYVDGEDLAAIVNRDGPLPVDKAVNFLVQAARGLEYAHSRGIVHRDIKPHNLLVDALGNLKILDMGLVRFEHGSNNSAANETLTRDNQIVGTVDYMAPEQAEDTRNADQRSDIYSLGCTLYRLLVGQPPYGGQSAIQKIFAHRERPIPSLIAVRDDVSPKLQSVFERMVAKKREDRYQCMSEVVDALLGCKCDHDLVTDDDTFTLHEPFQTDDSALMRFVATMETESNGTKTRSPSSAETTVVSQVEVETNEDVSRSGHHSFGFNIPLKRFAIRLAGAAIAMLLAGLLLLEMFHGTAVVLEWPEQERADAQLLIDGKEVAIPSGDPVQVKLRLSSGGHEITIKRRGYEQIDRTVVLRLWAHQRIGGITWIRMPRFELDQLELEPLEPVEAKIE